MPTNRSAAVAIATGCLAGFCTMLLHPTGADVIGGATHGAPNALAAGVHWLGIIAQPLVVAGALALTLRLRARRDLAVGAFVFFAAGSVAVIIAAAASGLVVPSVLRGMDTADAAQRAAMLGAMRYTGRINQAFAAIYAVLASMGIVLWSWAAWRGGELSRGLAAYGLVSGVALAAGVLSGHLPLHIHGFGLVVLVQGVWLLWAAAELWQSEAAWTA